MILKASERGDASQLAQYLLALRDNEHVELHEVRGFASEDLKEAFCEADAIARGTRCKNHLFSMSLNPPGGVRADVDSFEQAIAEIERKLGLDGQPRAIVFHEKDGRRHAHVVWSRIDTEHMRAINMPHYKIKLRDVSRALYLQHGWDMPRGLQDRKLRDPLNFSREEWQQARRAGLDPRELKSVFRQSWETSDSKAAFARALKERGFWLARGDRRGFVAVDYRGEVYSISRLAGVKSKELQAKLGDPSQLRDVEETKAELARNMTRKLETFIKDVELDAKRRLATIAFRKTEMVARHQDERKKLTTMQEVRWLAETKARAQRLPRGFSGIWLRLTGQYAKIKSKNEHEALQAWRRDLAAKDDLIFRQLEERQVLQRDVKAQRATAQEDLLQLREDVERFRKLDIREDEQQREQRREKESETHRRTRSQRQRRKRDFEP